MSASDPSFRPPAGDLRRHWQLDPDIVFLNHGSFGAAPGVVLDAQRRYRDRMELEPVRFMVRELEHLMDEARRDAKRYRRGGPAQLSEEEREQLRELGYLDS